MSLARLNRYQSRKCSDLFTELTDEQKDILNKLVEIEDKEEAESFCSTWILRHSVQQTFGTMAEKAVSESEKTEAAYGRFEL